MNEFFEANMIAFAGIGFITAFAGMAFGLYAIVLLIKFTIEALKDKRKYITPREFYRRVRNLNIDNEDAQRIFNEWVKKVNPVYRAAI